MSTAKTLDGHRVLIFVADEYEDLELWYPKLRLEEAGVHVTIAGPEAGKTYRGKHGYPCVADAAIGEMEACDFQGVLCPGGWMPDKIRRDPRVLALVRECSEAGKLVAAICHGGWIPISAGIYRGVKVTGSPGIKDDLVNAGAIWQDAPLVVDRHFVSSRKPADLPEFMTGMLPRFVALGQGGRAMKVPARIACLLFAAALGSLACLTSRSDAVEIIGHRGASHDAPENTLASIRLAWKQNADASETDVHLTKDGQIVVIHDFNTRRVGGRNKKVVEQTLAELKQLDIGRWKGEQFAGERIPTLSEYLAAIPEGKRLFIEIKCGPEIVPPLVAVLRAAHKRPKQTCLIGFSYDVMKAAKRELPELKCYWIVELRKNRETGRWTPQLATLIKKAKDAGLDGIDFGDAPVLDREFVSKVKQAGLGVYTWTVDSVQEAKRLQEAGVDGITTNRPGFLKESLMGHP